VAQAPRVLLIGKRIGEWVSLREATLSPCGCSQVMKGLWQVVSEFAVLELGDESDLRRNPPDAVGGIVGWGGSTCIAKEMT